MTKQDLKNRLNWVGEIDYKIQVVNLKIEKLESCIGSHAIRYDTERVQTSPHDAMSEVMAEIEPLLKERERLTVEMTKAIAVTSDLIDRLNDGKQCMVMHYRYTAGLPFDEIARRMKYSTQRIYQIHDNAIKYLMENVDIVSKKRKN